MEIRFFRPRSTMDSIRVSEAPDTGSIPVEATKEIATAISFFYPVFCSISAHLRTDNLFGCSLQCGFAT
jgi:hypothetical protein